MRNEGHKPDAMLHCGLCTSCLFRRVALYAGGLVPDLTRYLDVATRRHGAYEMKAFENHAADLSACRAFEDLVELDPDAQYATSLPVSDSPFTDAPAASVFAMYQRYAAEIRAYFDAAGPKILKRPQPPRKERERDLFSAAG